MNARRSFLVLLLAGIGLNGNSVLAEKHQDEMARATNGHAYTVGNAALLQNAKHAPFFVVNGTAARTGPGSLVEYQFTAPLLVGGVPVGGNIASGGQW
jgi:hypothetical protein